MRVDIRCFPCFLRQAVIVGSIVCSDLAGTKELIDLALDPIRDASLDDTPAHIATEVYKRIREKLNGADPFAELKSKCTKSALLMTADLEAILRRSSDPLEAAIRASVAGNVIDLGIYSDVDVESILANIMSESFGALNLKMLKDDLKNAKDILFLADNAGELVFDRPLISRLMKFGSVKVAVKSVPVINDATLQDAIASELPKGVSLIENGSDCVGTILSTCSSEFMRAFNNADLIISKGQANFETLDTAIDRNIYFLLKAKCDVTAEVMGVPRDSLVAVSNRLLPGGAGLDIEPETRKSGDEVLM